MIPDYPTTQLRCDGSLTTGPALTNELVNAYELEGFDATPSILGRSFLFNDAGLIGTEEEAVGMYLTPSADPTAYTTAYLMTRILKPMASPL